MPNWRVLIGVVVTSVLGQPATAKDFLAGANLYNDVARYASFGSHRFGSPGDRATADWIAGELQAAGLSVEFQPVILGRQYFVDRATAEVDGTTVDATPFWWPPSDKSSFRLTAPVARDGDVAGKILWIELPYDRVVARLGAGKGPAIVVSTPMTGWYSCVCERGPGIANFLALARTVAAEKRPGNFVFVATAGHEIGHGGMELFLKQGAPPPQDTLVWVHLGASNACFAWTAGPEGFATEHKVDDTLRSVVLSPSAQLLVGETFAAIGAKRLVAEKQAVGELRDVQAAGYPNFFGMAGLHRFFHTPSDDLRTTSPEILEPVARAFADAVRKAGERGERAFK